jgi:cell division septum initiation protein DivIVA
MSFETLLKERKLRVRLRGYDRRSTDDLLRAVEEALATLAAERDQLRRRLIEVEQEVNRFREEAHVAEEKLLAAQMAEADAVRACELLEVEAQRRAERLVAEAEARAAQIIAASKHESRPARPIV